MNRMLGVWSVGVLVVALQAAAGAAPGPGKTYVDGRGQKIYFPLGDRSFADEVVSFKPGDPSAKDARYSDPNTILHKPDMEKDTELNCLTLGGGGEITVRFTDNALIDVAGPDLYIFEVGGARERSRVAISKDNIDWIDLGEVMGGTAAVDIGASPAVKPGERYHYVRVTDLNKDVFGDWPGADIDAIGAIGQAVSYRVEKLEIETSGWRSLLLTLENRMDEIARRVEEHRRDFDGIQVQLEEARTRRLALANEVNRQQAKTRPGELHRNDAYWDAVKALALLDVAISDKEESLLWYQDRIDPLQDELDQLREQQATVMAHQKPLLDRISIQDAQGRVIARWEKWVPAEQIEALERDVKTLRKELRRVHAVKKAALKRWLTAVDASDAALNRVKDGIWNSALRQAFIEGGFYAYEVGKAWGQSGPFGALSTALRQAAETYAFEGGMQFSEVDEAAVKARVEADLDTEASYFDTSGASLLDTARAAALKEALFGTAQRSADKQVSARVTRYLAERGTEDLVEGIKQALPVETLVDRSNKVVRYNDHVAKLESGATPKLKDMATDVFSSFAKDVAKQTLKDVSKGMEEALWIAYFQEDIRMKLAHSAYDAAFRLHGDILEQYQLRRKLLADLIRGYDPNSGFRLSGSDVLEEGEQYVISLGLAKSPDRRARVWVGVREAVSVGPAIEQRYQITAKELQKKGEWPGGDVVLKVEFVD